MQMRILCTNSLDILLPQAYNINKFIRKRLRHHKCIVIGPFCAKIQSIGVARNFAKYLRKGFAQFGSDSAG